MSDMLIYHMPGACSRVALVALETLGVPYEDRTVSLFTGEQASPAFRAVNSKGKVPVLVREGVSTTELPVILYRLAEAYPEAGLLPADGDGRADLAGLSDLVWVAGALHPLANRIFRPGAVSERDADGVKASAIAQLGGHAQAISARLTGRAWWYGAQASSVDVFIAWVFSVATAFGFPLADYPELEAQGILVREQPAFQRARARELQAVDRDGLAIPPAMSL